MGIKKMLKRAGAKAADTVATLASLSPAQMLEVEELREAYLSEMPDPGDETAQELTMRLLASAGVEIYNAYLPQVKELYLPLNSDAEYDGQVFNASKNIRYFKITKWVTDKKENSIEKLVNVYANLSNENCNIALIFHRTHEKTETYLAVVNLSNSDSNTDADNFSKRIADALRGNFPGSKWGAGKGKIPFLNDETVYSVASASNIPTEKSEKFISQTIEKLLDGTVPGRNENEYSLLLLATPVRDVEERKIRLAELYSGLAPYAGWQTNYTYTQSDSTNSTATFGVNAGVSAGIQRGQNQADTASKSDTDSSTKTETESSSTTETDSTTTTTGETNSTTQSNTSTESQTFSESHTEGTNSSNSLGGGVTANASTTVGANVGVANASETVGGSVSVNYNHSWGSSMSDGTTASTGSSIAQGSAETTGTTSSESKGHAIARTTGRAVAEALGRAVTKGSARSTGTYKGVNLGGNFGANFARSSNVTASVGKNEGITQSYTNFTIKHTLEILEEQMKRYESSVALGMWDFAAYVLSDNINTVNNVAHSYVALTQGEKSYLSQASINTWRGNAKEEKEAAAEICKYLKTLRHPIFVINPEIVKNDATFNIYPTTVTATTSLSGKELAFSLNFPQKSIVGLPVLQCAEFGRNVVSYNENYNQETLSLGCVFHMNRDEEVEVRLSMNSLSGHTFVTGSTGSGKSNTVYRLLSEAVRKNAKFLVVEPAKGEYKTIFGNSSNVSVYGTNPIITPLLKINPFSFPKTIHVLEHLDRLVEIFNVCWPMYAAMPAVLKNAIEKSYEDCGWDLIESTNEFG
ncbi:MAG: DUF87 domain-containing protein, partial [Erysipelotrichaceae bacterium]|nr:DUF87 domain-containing protein [Erysipelotrichaceae bacterium]